MIFYKLHLLLFLLLLFVVVVLAFLLLLWLTVKIDSVSVYRLILQSSNHLSTGDCIECVISENP